MKHKGISDLNFESGRSMVETLAVLAIAGILSVVAVAGYKHSINKYKANEVVHDGQMIYIQLKARINAKEIPWTDDTTLNSKYHFQYQIDKADSPYVKVDAIPEGVCKQLLQMATPGRLAFYTIGGVPFTTCAESNEIVMAFEGVGDPVISCNDGSECAELNKYCNSQTGICESCPNGQKPNATHTECVGLCDAATQTECQNQDEQLWCCDINENGKPTICGENVGECIEFDGICEYTMTQQTQTKAADCWYDLSQTTDKNTLSDSLLRVGQGCTGNRYCYLAYKDGNCGTTAGGDYYGRLYGTCLERTAATSQCNVSEVTPVLTEGQGCTGNRYCYLAYKDKSCGATAGGDFTGTLYGTCLERTAATSQCNVSEVTPVLSETIGCPASQYCYLKWKAKECSATAGGDYTGTIYGTCLERTNTSPTCLF